MGAKRLGDLDRDVPQAACGGVDEHALAGLHLRDLGQRLPSGEPDERQRRGLHVVESRRFPGEPPRWGRDVLRIAAGLFGEAGHAEDLVAWFEQAGAESHCLDHA